ncbi:hypothetical protein PGIGA_G00210720 [Pangasianodon gigas]|uniref:Uncharacterized protein n=1 Tax=Pangasianodon gigas TaxID=30993 RepID=A0ACC5WG30_PANGG|nr:hypothetical protein [Pangasianodon gigas]
MMARPDHCSLFDLVVDLKLSDGLREISELQNHQETLHLTIRDEFPDDKRGIDGRRDEPVAPGEVSDRKFCSACQCSFESREEQMEHYKLDWHRFNLRQRLAGRSPITVEEFEKKTGMGDVSSISGSDSEDDESHGEDESDGADGVISYGGRLSTRVLLQNSQGQYLCLYRCAVQKRTNDSEANLVDSLLNISEKTVWVILMTGGGHFAGAVYKGKEVLQHKTFHRYTVRAKRGTAQSVRDTQNRGHAPKSAGAALRRYNEAALTKDIQELLKNWAEYLTQADAIFLRTPKYNRSVFFGGRGAPLEKKDPRIRSIPFATRRATFSEITRVHDVLSTLQIYDKTTDVCSILSSSKRTWQKKTSNQTNQNAAVAHQVDQQEDEEEEEEEEEEVSVQLQIEEVMLTTLDLREHELKPSKKKRRKRKERKPEATEKEGKAMQREDFGSRELKDETGNVKMGEEITEGKKNLKNNERDEEGRGAPLEKKDPRIRSIPFATRRATFSEITRVHDVLSTLQIYDKTTDVCSILSSSKRTWQKKTSNQTNQNAAVAHQVDQQEDEEEEEEEEEVSVQLQIEEVTLTTLDLREHELKPSKKKRRKRKERKPEATEKEGKAMQREDFGSRELKDETGNVKMGEEITEGKKNLKNNERDEEDEACALWEFSVRDALYTACKTGDTEALHTLLKQDEHASIRLLNTPIDSAGYTLLHVASAAAQKHAVQLLLEMGSDPTCRDRKGQTPYAVAPDKESRNMFRKFMAEHPNKYDYAKAQVPGPLTAEIESKKAEKKKAQKAAKKQREKEQREEKRREEEEQGEKRRFLALSDREKRALAAERRLAEQVATAGGTLTNIRRCWQCGESLLGKVPFEYLNYSFCSTRCVQTHRKSNSAAKP